MAVLKLEIATVDGVVYSGDVDIILAPTVTGQVGILPNHAPLMTMLEPGELTVRTDGKEDYVAVSGGFMEVLRNRVTILADAAERAEDIDVQRAAAARERAERLLKSVRQGADASAAEAALRRSMVRLKTAERRIRRRGRPDST